jgi:hypothetical protein
LLLTLYRMVILVYWNPWLLNWPNTTLPHNAHEPFLYFKSLLA